MGQGFSWNPLVQPLHQRGPEPAYCGVTHPAGHGLGTCNLDQGHDGNHSSGLANWPQARSNYRSDQLTGAKIDDLILDLFRRIEQLEQGKYADGPVADDMFAAMNRVRERLAQGLGEVEKRMTRLEQAQVYSTSPHDLSALQASINTQFERLNGAICQVNGDAQQRNQAMVDRLSAMWDVLAAMASIVDGPVEPEVPQCGIRVLFSGDQHCVLMPGHDGPHKVPDATGPVTHVEPGLDYPDTGTQTERASGSPAAVRCPTRFREGQCLGYAGHDGECSAVPDPEQLEDPEEFEHTSYASLDYLNRHGAPDEPEPARCSERVLGVRCTLRAGHSEDCSTMKF